MNGLKRGALLLAHLYCTAGWGFSERRGRYLDLETGEEASISGKVRARSSPCKAEDGAYDLHDPGYGESSGAPSFAEKRPMEESLVCGGGDGSRRKLRGCELVYEEVQTDHHKEVSGTVGPVDKKGIGATRREPDRRRTYKIIVVPADSDGPSWEEYAP